LITINHSFANIPGRFLYCPRVFSAGPNAYLQINKSWGFSKSFCVLNFFATQKGLAPCLFAPKFFNETNKKLLARTGKNYQKNKLKLQRGMGKSDYNGIGRTIFF
jgi:hypothetical protein